jgi:hypothetical protein
VDRLWALAWIAYLATIVATGLGLLWWILVVLPSTRGTDKTMIEQLTTLTYPFMDALLLFVLVRLAFEQGIRTMGIRLLTVSIATTLAADLAYALTNLIGVYADRSLMDLAAENLVANAVRHTPPGTRLWVKVLLEDAGVPLAVEDAGPGVPEDLRTEVFEPFAQGPSQSRHAPGVGIGLSLVARFAELHGGRAWVEERAADGTSFLVFLPGRVIAGMEPARDPPAAPVPERRAAVDGMLSGTLDRSSAGTSGPPWRAG